MKVSILIPVFNEVNYIEKVLNKINLKKKQLNLQIIVSDDGSYDGTEIFLKNNKNLFDNLIRSENNEGKGSAIKKALLYSVGDIVIIQDSDLEYDPNDYDKILQPFIFSNADVVYGNRFNNSDFESIKSFISQRRI